MAQVSRIDQTSVQLVLSADSKWRCGTSVVKTQASLFMNCSAVKFTIACVATHICIRHMSLMRIQTTRFTATPICLLRLRCVKSSVDSQQSNSTPQDHIRFTTGGNRRWRQLIAACEWLLRFAKQLAIVPIFCSARMVSSRRRVRFAWLSNSSLMTRCGLKSQFRLMHLKRWPRLRRIRVFRSPLVSA